jgi:Flp pilus assembly protein TadD
MKIINLVLLLLFVSCASNKKETAQKSEQVKDEFSHLNNDNFISPDPVLLDETDDYFENADGDYLNSSESLQFADEGDLDDYEDSSIEGMISLCYRKNFSEFEKTFQAINRKFRKHPGFWNGVGTCQLLMGKVKKSLLYYNQSREISKSYLPPVNNLGVVYLYKGEYKKALVSFQKAASMGGFSVTPVLNQVLIYTKFGLVSKAKKLIGTLYKQNDDDPNIVASYAFVSLLEKDYNRALNLYSSLDRDYRKNPKIALNYAAGLALNNNIDDAKDVLDEMRQMNTQKEKAYYQRIMSYIHKRGKK